MKYNIEKIDRKIEERKRIPLEKFIDVVEEMIRFKNEVKKIDSRHMRGI